MWYNAIAEWQKVGNHCYLRVGKAIKVLPYFLCLTNFWVCAIMQKKLWGYFVMMKYKYRHTFYLHSGKIIVAYSDVKELAHITLGRETAFLSSDEYTYYTIPFTSVDYVETEKTDE